MPINMNAFFKSYMTLAPAILDKAEYKIVNQIDLFQGKKPYTRNWILSLNKPTNHYLIQAINDCLSSFLEEKPEFREEVAKLQRYFDGCKQA